MKSFHTITPVRAVAGYLVFGVLWILLTDRILDFLIPHPSPTYLLIQTLKGWFYVGISAALIYLLLRSDIKALVERDRHITYQAGLLEKVSDALISTDADFNILSWNAAAERLYGWQAKEVLGKPLHECVPTQFYKPSWEETLERLHTSGSWMGDVIQECKDGRRISISTSISVLKDTRGALMGFIEVNRDFSSQSKVQIALRESQYMLTAAEEEAQLGSWKLDLRTKRITWSDQMFRIFGMNRADFDGDINRVIAERVHPEDMEIAQSVVGFPHETPPPGELSFRILLPDGSTRTLRTQGKLTRDNSGQPISVMGYAQDITERRQAEEQVRASEERYRRLIENIHEVIIEVDEGGNFVYLSPNYQEITGYSIEEELGKPAITHVHPDDVPALLKGLSALPKTEPRAFLYRVQVKNGVWQWIETTVRLTRTKNGELRIVGVARNITDRVRVEESLRESESRYKLLFENNPHPMWVYDLETLAFLIVNDAAVREYGYTREEFRHMTLKDIRPAGDVSALLKNVLEETDTFQRSDGWRHRRKDGSILDVEITSHSVRFEDRNARLVLVNDITERKQAEKALRESEEKYRLLAENITDVIWILDTQTSQFRYVSPSVEQLRGYTVEEVMKQSLTDALTPPSLEYLAQTLPARLELLHQGIHETFTDEIEQPCKDGSTVWTETNTRFIQNPETGHLEVYGVSRNIAERKRAETALRVSEENYRSLAESSDSAIAVLNREGAILYANPASIRVWGGVNITGKTIFDIYPPEYAGRYMPFIQKVIDEQVVDLNELETLINGQLMWFQVSMSPIKNSDGSVNALLLNAWDITERKQAEERLNESERRYRALFNQHHDAIFILDLQGRHLDVNQRAIDMLGYTREELIGISVRDLSTEPDQSLKIFERLLQGEHFPVYERLFKKKNGETVPVEVNAELVCNENGAPIHIQSVMRDITERKQANEALKRSERVLRLFVEHSPASIAMFDRDMRYIVHSRRYVLDYQLPDQDLTGRSHYEVFPEMPERWKEIHRRCLAGKIERADEDPFLRADGRTDYVHWEIHPWYDDDGAVGGIILFSEVITDRMKAREELVKIAQQLEESHSMLKLIIESAPIRVFWKDTESRYLGCNGLFAADAGFHSPAEIIGKFDDELVWNERAGTFQRQEREIIATGIPKMNKVELQATPNGGTMWVNVSMVPLKDMGGEVIGTLGIYEDITERKQAEEALKESEERFSTAFFKSPVSQSIITQETGEVLAVNDACCILFGYSREELIGAKAGDLALWANPAEELSAVEEMKRTGRLLPREVAIRMKSGEIRITIIEIVPIAWKGIPCLISTTFDITDRKQAEKKLKYSQERLLEAQELSHLGNWEWDLKTNTLFWSDEVFHIFDLSATDLTPTPEAFENAVHPEDRAGFLEQRAKMIKEKRAAVIDHRIVLPQGDIRHVQERSQLVVDETGEVARVIGTVQDITERIQAEKAILRHNEQLAEVVEIENSLAASLDQEQIYETLQRGIRRLLPDIATIFFSSFDAERGTIKARFGLQDHEPVDVSELPELPYAPDGQGTQSRVIHTRQPLIINSNLKNAFRQSVQVGTDERITQSALYVPMLVQDLVLGVLQVQSYSPNRFTDEDARVLLLIANTAAVTIQNARLFETAQKEIIERTQAEKALKTSEERLRLTLQTTSDGFWIVDMNGSFLEINNAYCEMSGYSREELLQMGIPDVEASVDGQEIKERIDKIQQEDHDRFETRHRRKDGSEFDVEVSVNMLDGESRVMICFCRDITERKQAECEIHQRSQDLLLLNTLNDAANRGESIDAIAELFAREARSMFNCQDSAIYLLSPDGQYLEMQSATISAGLTEQIERIIGVKIPRIRIPVRPGSHTEELIARKEGTLTTDPEEIQKWILEFTETTFLPALLQTAFKKLVPAIFKLLKINATINIPLVSFGRTIGMLDMSTHGEFTPEDLQRVRMLSHQMTAVILRKQAESNVRTQLKRITALNEIDRAISSSLDMRLSLDVVLNEVTSQLGVDAAAILLLDPIDQALEYKAGKGFRTANIRESHMRLGQGHAGQAGLERKVMHVPNLSEAGPAFLRENLIKAEHFVEYFGVPLIAKGLLKGVLEIFNRTPLTTDPDWMNYLETLGGQAAIAVDNAQLFEGIQRSNQELVTAYDATIAGWSLAMDLRDKETEGHTQRVTELTLKLAKRLGTSEREQVQMRRGALLHDIGKLGIPDHILLKPGKLTEEEWEVMRQHPTHAYEMLLPIKYLRPALDIPYAHHEKWDGTGYPRKLKGEQIPLAARIFAIVDVWDALRSDRPYRPGWSVEKVRAHIREQAGSHFDPQVVEAFLKMLDESPELL